MRDTEGRIERRTGGLGEGIKFEEPPTHPLPAASRSRCTEQQARPRRVKWGATEASLQNRACSGAAARPWPIMSSQLAPALPDQESTTCHQRAFPDGDIVSMYCTLCKPSRWSSPAVRYCVLLVDIWTGGTYRTVRRDAASSSEYNIIQTTNYIDLISSIECPVSTPVKLLRRCFLFRKIFTSKQETLLPRWSQVFLFTSSCSSSVLFTCPPTYSS